MKVETQSTTMLQRISQISATKADEQGNNVSQQETSAYALDVSEGKIAFSRMTQNEAKERLARKMESADRLAIDLSIGKKIDPLAPRPYEPAVCGGSIGCFVISDAARHSSPLLSGDESLAILLSANRQAETLARSQGRSPDERILEGRKPYDNTEKIIKRGGANTFMEDNEPNQLSTTHDIKARFLGLQASVGVHLLAFMADHREGDEIYARLVRGEVAGNDLAKALADEGMEDTATALQNWIKEGNKGHAMFEGDETEQGILRYQRRESQFWNLTVGKEQYQSFLKSYAIDETVAPRYATEELNRAYAAGEAEYNAIRRSAV